VAKATFLFFILSSFINLVLIDNTFSSEITLKDGNEVSFIKAPFLNPLILQDALALSKLQVVRSANRLEDSFENVDYPSDFEVAYLSNGEYPVVSFKLDGIWFFYQYQSRIENIFIIETGWNGGGSGTFKSLNFLSIDSSYPHGTFIHEVGRLFLGDRYHGKITINNETLHVGVDQGWFSRSGGTGYSWSPPRKKGQLYKIKILDKNAKYKRIELIEQIDLIAALRPTYPGVQRWRSF